MTTWMSNRIIRPNEVDLEKHRKREIVRTGTIGRGFQGRLFSYRYTTTKEYIHHIIRPTQEQYDEIIDWLLRCTQQPCYYSYQRVSDFNEPGFAPPTLCDMILYFRCKKDGAMFKLTFG